MRNASAAQLLKNFKRKFEPFLKKYFIEKIYQANKIDSITKEAINLIMDYTMSGGKRIRPAFLYYSYLAAGGENSNEIFKISMSIELLHSFGLIHDDIIDKDASRHGVATIHEKYKKIATKYNSAKEKNHFGNSMAIISGDITNSMAHDIIFNTSFPNEVKLKFLNKLEKIIFLTCSGQMLDVTLSYQNKTTEKQILEMHERKTAHYTFEGPAHLGCILAGADKSYINLFSKYALPLGKAFQIKDDIMGVFGNEKEIGKTVGSDIIEGKKTLLVMKALEKGNKKEKLHIIKCLNNKNISKKELEEFRNIIIKTGSLKYSEDLAKSFANEAKKNLVKINFKDNNAKNFFTGVVDYIVNRKI
ncbi:MAG: polyprenyl synthetase family protein [Candidatus Paceibacterota bacterium]|jgi:geranylgeranyl diphosphate synthase type I